MALAGGAFPETTHVCNRNKALREEFSREVAAARVVHNLGHHRVQVQSPTAVLQGAAQIVALARPGASSAASSAGASAASSTTLPWEAEE